MSTLYNVTGKTWRKMISKNEIKEEKKRCRLKEFKINLSDAWS